ncbi:MAG: C1 family peptidase [Cytophagales bacterium]|nr:C1 family peptidase [Cytophagales bacterium]
MKLLKRFFACALLGITASSWAQEKNLRKIKPVLDIEATQVKSQDRTGTCWSFSTISFIESELIRMGKGAHNLSEMYTVRRVYPQKADVFVRNHGNAQFSQGGLAHDVINAIDLYGMMPESAYSGLTYGDIYNHSEMTKMLKKILESVVENEELSPKWKAAFEAVLDVYLGKIPETFEYQGENYTPASFAKKMGIKKSDYISLTSFTHKPYYEPFVLQVPDNFSDGSFYNLPLDEFIQAIDQALANGYTLSLDADVSEKGFSSSLGLAIVPEERFNSENMKEIFARGTERKVRAEDRQIAYDSYQTTDDHLMHIVGTGKDAKGNKYYKVKNSWGTAGRGFEGNIYMSEAYMRMKGLSVLVHKDALSESMREKILKK